MKLLEQKVIEENRDEIEKLVIKREIAKQKEMRKNGGDGPGPGMKKRKRIHNVAFDNDMYKNTLKKANEGARKLADKKRIWYGEGGVFQKDELRGYFDHYDACEDIKNLEGEADAKKLHHIKKGGKAEVVFLKKQDYSRSGRTLGMVAKQRKKMIEKAELEAE